MTRLLSSRLKHNIKFIEKNSSNALEPEVWVEKFSCFAEVIPFDEKNYAYVENFNFGQLVTLSLLIFRIRYVEDKLNNFRIEYNNRLFEIKKVTNIAEKNNILTIIGMEII